MKILFISLEGEADHIRDLLKKEWQCEIIEISTDSHDYLEVFKREQPQAVFIRYLGYYSHGLAVYMRKTGIAAKFITYTFNEGFGRVNEMATHKFDGYFHLQMQPISILNVFGKVMQGYEMLYYDEKDLI